MSPKLGRISFWVTSSGLNLCFLPMHVTGLLGMPRRVFTYPGDMGWNALNMVSTVGAFVLATGIVIFTWDLVRPRGKQPPPSRNPCQAGTLEWSQDIPEEFWGARSVPYISTRYPLWQQSMVVVRMDAGRFYLADSIEGLRETLVTSVIDAKPLHVLWVTGPAVITMLAAPFTCGAFIFPTFHWYTASVISGILAVICICNWLWTSTAEIPITQKMDVGLGLKLPAYVSGPIAVGWWGMFIIMLADAEAFTSLIFGVFFYWTSGNDFPPPNATLANTGLVVLAMVLLILSWLLTLAARQANRVGGKNRARNYLSIAPLIAAGGIYAFLESIRINELDPTSHVYPVVVWALVVWTIAHSVAGIVMQTYCALQLAFKRVDRHHDAPLCNITIFWHFHAISVLATAALIGLLPSLV